MVKGAVLWNDALISLTVCWMVGISSSDHLSPQEINIKGERTWTT